MAVVVLFKAFFRRLKMRKTLFLAFVSAVGLLALTLLATTTVNSAPHCPGGRGTGGCTTLHVSQLTAGRRLSRAPVKPARNRGKLYGRSAAGSPTAYTDLSTVTTLVEKDLQRCSPLSLSERQRQSTPLAEMAQQKLEELRFFIPADFLDKFNNPCWNVTMRAVPRSVYLRLKSLKSDSIYYTKKRADFIMSYFKNQDNFTKATNKTYFFCLPRVYLAGFPKSGTTTLYWKVTAHPLIAKPLNKEGHFWRTFFTVDRDESNQQLHIFAYLIHFFSASQYIRRNGAALTLDASASTIFMQNPTRNFSSSELTEERVNADMCVFPSLVYSLTPNAQFVVIMRNPVKRLFSDFWYFCANHNWVSRNHTKIYSIPEEYSNNAPQLFHQFAVHAIKSFQRCIKNGIPEFECVSRATHGYMLNDSKIKQCFPLRIGISMYYFHIVRWLNVFPKESFLFLTTEDLSIDVYQSAVKVWEFLGLDPISRQEVTETNRSESGNQMHWIRSEQHRDKFYILPETQKLLEEFYRPFNERLFVLLGRDERYLWQ